eukprot:scaffold487457_cov36-Prasinocladus_malaysianus.AAC.1
MFRATFINLVCLDIRIHPQHIASSSDHCKRSEFKGTGTKPSIERGVHPPTVQGEDYGWLLVPGTDRQHTHLGTRTGKCTSIDRATTVRVETDGD